jgi:ribosomal protein S12 methylthiotransferase
MPKKVNIVTLGCSKNLVDSEVLMKQLQANSFQVVHDSDEQADAVIINTCGFIGDAKEESIQAILGYCKEKEEGRLDKVFVIGCLSERYADELRKEIPEVDQYFGTKDLKKILQVLDARYMRELIDDRLVTTPGHIAYLKISEGCDRSCAFCAIPIIRGKHESVPAERLLVQAKKLVAGGAKEIMLIAQDLSYYGLDLNKKRQLPELLRMLSDESGAEWIRLHYAYPNDFPKEVFGLMRERANICKYLDMPLQHCTDNMLKLMRRNISAAQTAAVIEEARSQVPGITLRTTMLVGHPGETRADFDELCQFADKYRFDRMGVFAYSHEEGTHAYTSYADDIPDEEKQSRAETLMQLQQHISYEINWAKVGSTQKVLIDRQEGFLCYGRTESDSYEVDNEVIIEAAGIKPGDFCNVLVTEAQEFDLIGKIAD